MNQLTKTCAALALTVLAACAATPEGQKIQLQGWVKIAAQAALEEQQLSVAELEQLAGELEALAEKASAGTPDVSAGSLAGVVNKALSLQGYKAAVVEGVLLQLDVVMAEQGVVLGGQIVDLAKYSDLLKVAAKGVRQAVP